MENEGGFFDIDEFVVETKSHENKLKFQKKDKKKEKSENSNSKRKGKEQEEEKEDEFESNANYNFDDEKKQYLDKLNSVDDDRSRAGKADAPIIPLLDKINSKKDFFTTSSCAGRIIITQSHVGENYNVDWLFVSHDEIKDYKEILSPLQNLSQDKGSEVWIKMEPFIVAICCRDVVAAQKLLDYARSYGGLKQCAITGTRKRVIMRIVDTQRVETLLAKDGKLLVDEKYIQILAESANSKLNKTRIRMNNLKDVISQHFT